jgi:hypothetical protein
MSCVEIVTKNKTLVHFCVRSYFGLLIVGSWHLLQLLLWLLLRLLLLLWLHNWFHLGLMFGNPARHSRTFQLAEIDAARAVGEGLSGVRTATGGQHTRYACHPCRLEQHTASKCYDLMFTAENYVKPAIDTRSV